ncbi:MAG: hypothetical protein FJY19_04995 [Bacteroidetes bacterium]|nr:hypothetical protein [Bacteroidota bacterium]
MKKSLVFLLVGLLAFGFSNSKVSGQSTQSIGFSYFLNDFTTAERIRTTSLNTVVNNKSFAEMGEMNAGVAVNYFKSMGPKLNMGAYLGFSGVRYPMPGRNITNRGLLIEFSATLNKMMTTEDYYVQPYLTLGVGGHKFGSHYGAFIPAGLGLKLNIFSEANLFMSCNYRVPVTNETANYHFQHMIGLAAPLGKKK